MSIAYKKLIMGRTVKFIKIKLCKSCNKNLNYKNFRIVKPLTKGPNKGKLVAWTDIQGGKRFNTCKDSEVNRARNRYSTNPIPQMLSNSRIRAKRKGILHTINTEYLELIWPKDNRCPVLGNLFEMGYKNGKSKNLSPSLDRIVAKKGYIPGNLAIVSDIVNRLKSDASLEDMEKILKFYTNKNNKINNI